MGAVVAPHDALPWRMVCVRGGIILVVHVEKFVCQLPQSNETHVFEQHLCIILYSPPPLGLSTGHSLFSNVMFLFMSGGSMQAT